MTNPDWVPTMRRAAARRHRRRRHDLPRRHRRAASCGVPCVVGARTATSVLRDGEVVTVDGAAGRGARGRRADGRTALDVPRWPRPPRRSAPSPSRPRRALRQPRHRRARRGGRRAAGRRRRPAARRVHDHRRPRRRASASSCSPRGGQDEFVDRMAASLLRITRAFAPRPVVYRTIDFRTNEFRGLDGGERVRAGRGQPDDRLPRLLPLRPRARPVRPRARRCSPGCARRRRTCT